jgi:hypothetical protein
VSPHLELEALLAVRRASPPGPAAVSGGTYINREPPAVLTPSKSSTFGCLYVHPYPLSHNSQNFPSGLALPYVPTPLPSLVIIPFSYQSVSNNTAQLRLPLTILLYRFHYLFNRYGRALSLLLPYFFTLPRFVDLGDPEPSTDRRCISHFPCVSPAISAAA